MSQTGALPPSNFTFLKASWPAFAVEASKAERNVMVDPRTACFYARRTLELAVTCIYDVDRELRRPWKDDLAAMTTEPTFVAAVEVRVRTKMDLIRKQGNAAVHRKKPVSQEEALAAVRDLFHVMYWLARTYARPNADKPHPSLSFEPAAIPRPMSAEQRQATREALAKREQENEARDAELLVSKRENADLQAELERVRAEIAAAKAALVPDEHDYDEAETRDRYIDQLLHEAGWPLEEGRDREYEVSGMPNTQGVGYVDYVLWGADGKPLGVVEAKRTKRSPQVGQQQAKLYADCLEAQSGQRPVIYYSTGYEHWLWDDTRYGPRQVQGFATRDELALMVNRRTTRLDLADVTINTAIAERPYQQRAIRNVDEAFEAQRRKALLVMATGAGKTRAVIALVDQLLRAGWVKRVLFLADRVALVDQAVGAFKEHLPTASTVNLVTERNQDGRVYASTYPTVMGLIGEAEAGEPRRFGPDFFDLVVIDEAHRSVYQKYGAIFRYFDSLLVGLTATPKDEVSHDTYGLFELPAGEPTDYYGIDDAVAERFLVPPRAMRVPVRFPNRGIRYDQLSKEEQDRWEGTDWGEGEEPPELVDAEAVNRWLFNIDTVDKVLATLLEHGHRVAGGDRLAKTIIFARTNRHAEFIAERFDKNYPEHAGHFARVITYKTEYARTLIDGFKCKEEAPHIAISVDMLDTGIDVPEVSNLVFFKPVRSKTKFWQMLGRGTRLCRDLFGPGEDKQDFYVFDCCENLAYFNQEMTAAEGSATPSLQQRLFGERVELVVALRKAEGDGDGTQSEGGLRADTVALLRAQVEAMNVDNFLVRPQRRWVEEYREAAAWDGIAGERAIAVAEHLADLPTSVRDTDEEAKRFDLIVLRLQLGRLRAEPGQERLRRQVQTIAAGLLEQLAIPAIRAQKALLRDLADDEWWADVTLPMLEYARRRVRGLVRLLEKRARTIVYTDFVDDVGLIEEIELAGLRGAGGYERFREKARVYLRVHEDHVALQKLRRNKPLTRSDLEELDRMLAEAGVGEARDLERAREEAGGLGRFVRSLVGLERGAATEALSGFIDGRSLTADQLHFVSLVVEHLTQNGGMDAGLLYESPFTDVAVGGPEGLFEEADVTRLVAIIDALRVPADADENVA